MKVYRYKAAGKNGEIQKGVLEASSAIELKQHVQELGMSLITYSLKFSFPFSRKVSLRTLMDLCLHLEQFENSGIPLMESLTNLSKVQADPKLKLALREIIKDVEGGSLFSKALASHPSVFDPVFIVLIATGEKTGHFSLVLHHLFQHLKWKEEVQDQALKALRYPFIMTLVLLSVVIILMTVLVPELARFVETFSGNLPFSTCCLIAFSSFLSKNIYILMSAVFMSFILLTSFFKFHKKGPYWKDFLLNLMPLIGPWRYKIVLARFCHIFAIMVENGIEIIQALQTARQYVKYGSMYHALEGVERLIKEGESLSNALQKVDFFPPILMQMVKLGEQTSSLHKTLFHVKDYFDASLKRQVDHGIGLLEPLMILSLGAVMAWIIYSVFLPLYDTLSYLDC